MLNTADARYLLESVWRNQSVLSEDSDMAKLVLRRWDAALPISPWNCILLTVEEAKANVRLSDDLLCVTHELFRGRSTCSPQP